MSRIELYNKSRMLLFCTSSEVSSHSIFKVNYYGRLVHCNARLFEIRCSEHIIHFSYNYNCLIVSYISKIISESRLTLKHRPENQHCVRWFFHFPLLIYFLLCEQIFTVNQSVISQIPPIEKCPKPKTFQ